MANDVVINVRANDLASRVFDRIAKKADTTSSSFNRFGQSASRLDSILNYAAGYAAAIAGIDGISEAIHATIGETLDYYKTMQSGAIATAGTLMSVAKINGKNLGWNESMEYSTEIMRKLTNQAIATGVATKELTDSFRGALPAALQGGMTVDQLIKILAPLTSAGKLIGLQDTVLMRDINDILTGQNVGRTKLGQMLGLDAKDIADAKANGKLYEFLMQRLQGEAMATTKYLETFEGRVNHLKEAFARVGGMGLSSAFDTIKEDIQAIAEQLVVVDQKTQEVYIRPEALETFQAIGELLKTANEQVKLLIQDFSSSGSLIGSGLVDAIKLVVENLRTAVKTVAALWVGSKILSYVNDVKAGLTGVAESHTLIGRAAAAAREEIVKEELAQKELALSATRTATNRGVSAAGNGAGTSIASNAEAQAANAATYAITKKQQATTEAAAAANRALSVELTSWEALAYAVPKSTAGITAQENAYKSLAVQSGATAEVQTAGHTAAAAAAERSTASLALVEAQTRQVGIQAEAAGAAAELANYRATRGMSAVVAGLKGIGKAVLALTGGWVGLGMAAAYAVYQMNNAYTERKDKLNANAIDIGGTQYSRDENGRLLRLVQVGQYHEFQDKGDSDVSVLNDIYDNRLHQKQIDEEVKKREEAEEHAKEVQEAYLKKHPEVEDPNKALPEELNQATYGFENAADETKDATKKMAAAVDNSAKQIQQANERIANVIESLQNSLIKLNGSTYESAVADANKSYRDTLKQIEESRVRLTMPGGTASGVGGAVVAEAASHPEGEQWMSPEVKDATVQCAAFVSELYKRVGVSGLGSNNGDDLVAQFGGAYHDVSTGYAPQAGDLINWQDHVGISDGQGGYWARNSQGGVHHGSMSEAEDWFGPALGYGSIGEYTGSGTGSAPAATTTEYVPKDQMDKARGLAENLLDERIKEANRQLGIRQRKQAYETQTNIWESRAGDNRENVINAKYGEQEAEARDRQKEIHQSIAGDTSDPAEKARAQAEAEKAVNAEILKDEQQKNAELRALEDTRHSERLSHIEYEGYMNNSMADDITTMREAELEDYISTKQKELSTASLTAQQRIEMEKNVLSAQKELDAERQKSWDGGLESLRRKVNSYQADIGSTMQEGWDGVTTAFTNFGQNIITEHKSLTSRLKSMWEDMVNSIINSLMKIAMQKTLQNIITGVSGGGKSSKPTVGDMWAGIGSSLALSLAAKKADGGYIAGPGSGTSDSIPARLSNGEYVVNAEAVRNVGVNFLDSINSGYISHFSTGGYVGAQAQPAVSSPADTRNGGVQIIVENNTGTPVEATAQQSEDDNGRQLTRIILSTVSEGITNNTGHLRELISGVR